MNSVIHSTAETNGKSALRSVSGCYVTGMLASPLHRISSSHLEDLNVTKMRLISLLAFCLLTRVYRIFLESLPPPFVLFGFFVMDIWGFPACPPPHSFRTFLGELNPFSCGLQQSPWGVDNQRVISLHITQITSQQPKPGS